MALMETNGTGDWYSVVDALDELKISRRTLYHRINKGELQSKKDGKFRYIWIDDTVDLGNNIYTDFARQLRQLNTTQLKHKTITF